MLQRHARRARQRQAPPPGFRLSTVQCTHQFDVLPGPLPVPKGPERPNIAYATECDRIDIDTRGCVYGNVAFLF